MSARGPVVVGGGLAGVVAALHVAARGLRPVVLEADAERLGGRWRGGGPEEEAELRGGDGRVWRFPAEHGIHGLWGQYHNLRATLSRFLGPESLAGLVAAERQEWIYAAGGARTARRVELGSVVTHTRVPAPFHYLALFARPSFLRVMTPLELAALPWVFGSLQAALAFDPLVRPRDAAALRGVPLRRFFFGWSPRLRALVAALGRSGLFADPDVAPAAGFLAFLRFYTLLRRDAQRFQYLAADPERVVFGPLRTRLVELGARIELGARVERLERAPDGAWRCVWRDQTGGLRTVVGRPLVLAVDAPAARELLAGSPDTRAVAETELDWPHGLPNAVARLWWDRPPADAPERYAEAGIFGGDFTGDNVFWLQRIQRASAFAVWAAESGGSACEVHVYGPDEVLAQPDAAILARVALDVRRAYPALREARLLLSMLRRNPPSHTLFNVGATERHLGVETPWPDLLACGDWVRYPSPALFLERATITGIAAANAALRAVGRRDEEAWPIVPVGAPEPLARALGAAWRVVLRI